MLYLADWASSDRRILLNFAPSVVDCFGAHVQDSHMAPEGGGILMGCVRGAHLQILQATAPSPHDSRFRFLFIREAARHRQIAEGLWRSSGGIIRYLGEWHTHPEDHPQPSTLDRREWKTLAQAREDSRPLLAVIVGRLSLHVELVSANGKGVVFEALNGVAE